MGAIPSQYNQQNKMSKLANGMKM